jgi:TolB-like protein/Tfp pilus assembly protein PilF
MSSDQAGSAETPPPTVFLSYSRVDQAQARLLAQALEEAGLQVWWDTLIEAGAAFAKTIETALAASDAVIVLWSRQSVASDWVLDEAARGRDLKKLVPLSIDGTEPPLGFRQYQSIRLEHGKGGVAPASLQAVLRAVALVAGREALPRPPAASVAPLPVDASRRGLLIGGGAVAVAAAVASVVGWSRGWFDAPRGSGGPRRIAVLPFDNLSGDPEQRYFSDGLTSEIRVRLSRNALLQIAGQTSSERVADGKMDGRAIARALGVDFLLGGNVQKAGGRVKVAAELVDGTTGLSRWADSWERPLADVFAVQSEIGAAVAGALSAAVEGPDAGGGAMPGGTDDVSAFDAYLHGRALYEAGIDEASDRRALQYFERAIEIDGRYAGAHAARARALVVIGNLYAAHDERVQAYDAAEVAARTATTLAPDFAEAFSALGFALASGKLDMRGAREPFERSYALAPGNADVLARYATFRSNLRDHARATDVIRRAATLDPLNARAFRSQGDIRHNAGDHAGAIMAYRRAIDLNPTLAGVNASMGFAQLMAGADDDARASFSRERGAVRRLPGLAILAHRAGDRTAAEAALAELVAEYGDKSHYQYAQVHAQWGDAAKALASLQAAWDLRDGGIMLMYADPLLAGLHGTDGYVALAKSVGFA